MSNGLHTICFTIALINLSNVAHRSKHPYATSSAAPRMNNSVTLFPRTERMSSLYCSRRHGCQAEAYSWWFLNLGLPLRFSAFFFIAMCFFRMQSLAFASSNRHHDVSIIALECEPVSDGVVCTGSPICQFYWAATHAPSTSASIWMDFIPLFIFFLNASLCDIAS